MLQVKEMAGQAVTLAQLLEEHFRQVLEDATAEDATFEQVAYAEWLGLDLEGYKRDRKHER